MGAHDQELDGEWTNHGEEIDEIEDLEDISAEPGEGFDPPLEVAPATYDASQDLLEEPTGVTPFDMPATDTPDSATEPPGPVDESQEPSPSAEPDPTLDAAIEQALAVPSQMELWDQLEELAKKLDRASEVAAAYRKALNEELERDLALDIIDRAVQFHDEWLDDPDDVFSLLNRVLEIDPAARWAFDRISLKFTMEARWDELLALYDKVIAATTQETQRIQLLDEAAAVAKDCAGNPERAIDYLLQVFALRPTDHQTGSALERLLKQQKQFRALIDFWTTRLEVLTGQEALSTRQQIATCWLEDLNDPNGALAAVEPLLDDPRTTSTAGKLLEMILGSPASTSSVRARALELLSEKYDGTKRWRQVVQALGVALSHVPGEERIQIHQEIARRLVEHDAHEEALPHLASLVALVPETWTDTRLEQVLKGKFSDKVFGCKPVFDREGGRRLLHLAADKASLHELLRERAIELYRKLIEDKPDDNRAITNLTKLYSGAARTDDLLQLRQHELGLCEDIEKRLALRLEVADLFAQVDDEPSVIATLRDNLGERADHEPTIDTLIERLEAKEQSEALAELLITQAPRIEELDRKEYAASLWMKAARVSQSKLLDLDQAIECYQRVVVLQPNLEALDELATMFVDRKQFPIAVDWLEKRLAITQAGQRTPTVVRLARAHVEAGQRQEALTCLQSGMREDLDSLELRDLLADLYRRDEAWTDLVDVLLDGSKRSSDDSVRHRYLLEAADVLQHRLRSAEQAVPVLEQIVALQPKDRAVRVALADALRVSGRTEEARNLASSLIKEYGRRHPPERAKLHLLLAQVLRAQEKPAEAIKQLEIGVSMDMGNVDLQHMLGQVYRETGELEKAERAYHALILLLRRRSAISRGTMQEGDVGIAEALFELHLVAKELGADERAAENLESAFDAASLDPMENERFERALRISGNAEMLLRALERRLSSADGPQDRARVLSDIASAQEQLDQHDRALASLIKAIEEAPDVADYYDRAQVLAEKTGELADYMAMLDRAAERALAEDHAELGSQLIMQLGRMEENNRRDLSRAAALYARAEDIGCNLSMVWAARARVAALLEDESVELEMLRRLTDESFDASPSPERTDALFRLAELELGKRETLLDGVGTLAKALEAEPRHEQAARTLQAALVLEPGSESVIHALESVARAAFDDVLLLEALEKKARLERVSQDILLEGVEVAERLESPDRVEALLLRSVEVAQKEGSLRSSLWALQRLAALRETQGDLRDAIHWLKEAAQVSAPEEARAMNLRVAQIAAGPLEDLDAAAQAYDSMLRQEPGEPTLWQPLLQVLQRLGDLDRLESMLKSTIENVTEVALRTELGIEHARLLRDMPGRHDEAIEVLRKALEEDPEHVQAAEIYADLLQEAGRDDALVELLGQQLAASRERSDTEAGVQFALRLADIHGEENREAGQRVYRNTLEWVPGNAQLIRGLLLLLDPEADAAERADLIEGLLGNEGVEDPLTLSLDLIEARSRQGDRDGLERALELAFEIEPTEPQVLEHLQRLAENLESEAKLLFPAEEAVGLLLRASTIFMERLDDPASAGRILTDAQDIRPSDLGILEQLVHAFSQSGQLQSAVDRVTEALDRWTGDDAGRANLYRIRAELWASSGEHESAAHDLEQARNLEGDSALPDLYDALLRARESAAERSDFDAERAATLRLVSILQEMGQADQARDLIAQWTVATPEDMEAIRLLLDMDRDAGQWENVASNAMRLVELESGPARAQAALWHAEACDQLERPTEARESLELVFRDDQTNEQVRGRLRVLYEQLGEYRELSNLLLADANQTEDDAARFELLRDAGRLRLANFDQAASAIGPLSEALELQPNDLEVTVLLADAYISAGLIQETVQLLQAGIDRQGGRRSRELAALQHRMARAAATSDRNTEMQWLLAAFESYPQGTDVAAELADLATELREYDVALKALRALATAKTQGPISRPMAFLKQAQIAQAQGDDRKAMFLVKKAISMDPDFAEARDFLDQLGPG